MVQTDSVLVDRRSSAVSDRTLQSLQKIESAVERSSSDTRELIKAAWDKMLGNVGRSPGVSRSDSSAREEAAGIAAELRSEITDLGTSKEPHTEQYQSRLDKLEEYLKRLETSLAAQLKIARADARPSEKYEEVLSSLRKLNELPLALMKAIKSHHLSQTQYKALADGSLGQPVLELRQAGLLVPVVSAGGTPSYYYPPETAETIRALISVFPEPPTEVQLQVGAALKGVKY